MHARYRLDDLRIDVARQRVERDGVALEVTGLSFRLLHYLLQQGQRVVDFDELIQNVWAPALVNEETVTQRVRLLRQALGDDSRQPRYLRSVRGQGYQLCVPVQLDDAPPAGGVPRRGAWIIAAGALLICVGVGATWWLQSRDAPSVQAALLQRADYYAGIGHICVRRRCCNHYVTRRNLSPCSTASMPISLPSARNCAAAICCRQMLSPAATHGNRQAAVVRSRPVAH